MYAAFVHYLHYCPSNKIKRRRNREKPLLLHSKRQIRIELFFNRDTPFCFYYIICFLFCQEKSACRSRRFLLFGERRIWPRSPNISYLFVPKSISVKSCRVRASPIAPLNTSVEGPPLVIRPSTYTLVFSCFASLSETVAAPLPRYA